jgi:DNA-binding transcriptional LysR family regulator
MDLAQLETFLAVVEEKGFSRAAARLHRTQPAVSHVIRRLEDEIGEPLFERSSRDGTLTAAGNLLCDYARRLLKLRGEASSALEELRSLERGHLQLAANEYTCLYLLPILDEFRRRCPHISVVAQRSLASRIPDQILDRSVEMGIVTFAPPGEQFVKIEVYTDPVVFVVNPKHPLAREKEIAIRDLGAESFVAHNVVSPLRRDVMDFFAKHKTPLNMNVELPSLEAIKRFVAMGNGVAFAPGLSVQDEVKRGDLVQVHVSDLEIDRQLLLIHRRHATLSHAALAFLKTVQSLAKERGMPFQYQPATEV